MSNSSPKGCISVYLQVKNFALLTGLEPVFPRLTQDVLTNSTIVIHPFGFIFAKNQTKSLQPLSVAANTRVELAPHP